MVFEKRLTESISFSYHGRETEGMSHELADQFKYLRLVLMQAKAFVCT